MSLLAVFNFIERIQNIYDECLSQEELNQGMTGENIFLDNLVYMCQNSPKTQRNDGFPLILVLFDVVQNCLNLLNGLPYKPKNQDHKNVLKYWEHH